MNYNVLLQKVEEYVHLFFAEHIYAGQTYHNLSHTKDVVAAVKKIATHYQLDDHSWFIICAAAWFHDTGYLITNRESHELKSAELAENFLKVAEANEEEIDAIKKCILATKIPQQPVSLLEKIICDADVFYFGTDAFKENNKRLRKENEALINNKIDGNEWISITIKMLESHVFHTDYCRSLLDSSKADQLIKLKTKRLKKLPESVDLDANVMKMLDDESNTIKTRKKERPEKGIESMFRISATNNVRVSAMADNKAHIMITVNAIIISVILGLAARNISESQHLLIPAIILLTVSLLTITYAVLATRPKISTGVFTPEQVKKKSVNLLYFGSYYKMNFKEYNEGVKAMMGDSEFLYGSLTKDIYWQGKVLGRKYRLLHIAYSIFMYGIIISVMAFAAAALF